MNIAQAGLWRRLAAAGYELLILLAVWMVLTALFILVFGIAHSSITRFFLQSWLWVGTGVYFVWQWRKGGKTLAMRTWKLRLVCDDGRPLSWYQAIARYSLANLSLLLLGLGFVWALWDKQNKFLHDRWLGTSIICAPP